MDWKKAIIFGVALWILKWVLASISHVLVFRIYEGYEPEIANTILAGVVAYLLAGNAKFSNRSEAFKFGLTWVVVVFILDLFLTLEFLAGIKPHWTIWIGYALIFTVPVLRAGKK